MFSETNAIGTGIAGRDYLDHPESSGRCSAVLDLRIVDASALDFSESLADLGHGRLDLFPIRITASDQAFRKPVCAEQHHGLVGRSDERRLDPGCQVVQIGRVVVPLLNLDRRRTAEAPRGAA